MTRAMIAGVAWIAVAVLSAGCEAIEHHVNPGDATSPVVDATDAHPSSLYGRIVTIDGDIFEGRMRWGGDEEAFWGDYFNGAKRDNPWVGQVPAERLPKEKSPLEIFGLAFSSWEQPAKLDRLFMARFGDIARVEADGRDVWVSLKSGTRIHLDRYEAGDFDDGVRVWDQQKGVVDLDTHRIRSIEFLPAPGPGAEPDRLHGTVHTAQGDFTGFLQWGREECVGSDQLRGQTADGEISLRFDAIRSIAHSAQGSALVTLLDGGEREIFESRQVGASSRGVYVDDPRYGRVLISWDAFEQVDFSPGGSGPAYGEFPPGSPLTGSVTTRGGAHLTGRLVYDLDESEDTETLDAPSDGVNYTIPFGLIASIVLDGPVENGASVTLRSGEELQLERTGDLGEANAGVLIFVDGRPRPEYLPWAELEQIDLDPPPAMYVPRAAR